MHRKCKNVSLHTNKHEFERDLLAMVHYSISPFPLCLISLIPLNSNQMHEIEAIEEDTEGSTSTTERNNHDSATPQGCHQIAPHMNACYAPAGQSVVADMEDEEINALGRKLDSAACGQTAAYFGDSWRDHASMHFYSHRLQRGHYILLRARHHVRAPLFILLCLI